MNIFLGNKQLNEVVKPEYLPVIQKYFDENDFKRTENTSQVKNREGNYHIYDIPQQIIICGEKKLMDFYEFIKANDLFKAFIAGTSMTYCDLGED